MALWVGVRSGLFVAALGLGVSLGAKVGMGQSIATASDRAESSSVAAEDEGGMPAVGAKDAGALPEAPAPQAQSAKGEIPLEYREHPEVHAKDAPKHIFFDLGHIFISPIYVRPRDLKWIAPLAGASIAAFATDTHVANDVVSHNPDFNNTSASISNDLRDTAIAVPVAMYGIGLATHNEHSRETGQLGGEAMIDALVVDEAIKLVSFRERPYQDNGRGNFYQSRAGVDSSFISGHAMVTWSSAAVIADEYRSPWIKIGAYTAATAVSVDRVLALQHFPTDVLLGSAGGWLIGHYVYRAHHHADRHVR